MHTQNNSIPKGRRMRLKTFIICIILLCASSSVLMKYDSKREWIVGETIPMEDITEFYYTYAISTFPPDYQRYHFYTEDGAYFFFHEKREGEVWPLTEEYATVTDTIRLSEQEWATFLSYLQGGTAKKRKEIATSGTRVSLYLYWEGDRSQYQQFSFVSPDAECSFEDFCVTLQKEGAA